MEDKAEAAASGVRGASIVEENANEHERQRNEDNAINDNNNKDANVNTIDEQDQKVLDALKLFESAVHHEVLQDTLRINEQATSACTAMRELLQYKNERIATLRAENATRQSELDYALETINTLTRQLAHCETNLSITLTSATNESTYQTHHVHEDIGKNVEECNVIAAPQECTLNGHDIARLYSEHVLLQNQIAQYKSQEEHWREIVERVNITLQEIVQENITLRRQLLHYQSTTIPIQNYTEIVNERNELKEQLQLTELKVKELVVYTDNLKSKIKQELFNDKDNHEGEHEEEEEEEGNQEQESENLETHSEHSVHSDRNKSSSNNNKDLLEMQKEDEHMETESAHGEMWDAAIAELEKRANAIVDYDNLVVKLKETEYQLASTCNQNTELIKEINELRKVNTCLRVDSQALEFRNKVFEEQVISLLGKVNMLYCSCSNLHKVNRTLRQERQNTNNIRNNREMPSHNERNQQLKYLEKQERTPPPSLCEGETSSQTKYNSSSIINEPVKTGRRLSVYSGRVPGFGLRANVKKEAATTSIMRTTQPATIDDEMCFDNANNYTNMPVNVNNNSIKLQETEFLLTGEACKQPNAAELNTLHRFLCSKEEQEHQFKLWSSLTAHDEFSPFAVNNVKELVERNQELVQQLYLLSTNNLNNGSNKEKEIRTTERKEETADAQKMENMETLSSDNSESDAAAHDSTHVPQRKRRRVEIVAEPAESDPSEDNNNGFVNVDSDSDEDVDEEIVSSSSSSSRNQQYEEEEYLSEDETSSANRSNTQIQSDSNCKNQTRKIQQKKEEQAEEQEEEDEEQQDEEEPDKDESNDVLSHQVKTIIKEIMESKLQANHAETSESKNKCYLSLLDVICSNEHNQTNVNNQQSEEEQHSVFHPTHAIEVTHSFLARFVKPLITLCVKQAMTLGKQQCQLLEQHELNTLSETSTWQSAQGMLTHAMESMKNMISVSSRQLIEECHSLKSSNNNESNNNNNEGSNYMFNASEVELINEFISLMEFTSRKENNLHRLQDIAYERHEAWMTEKANKLARLAAIAIKYNNNNSNGDFNNNQYEREVDLKEIENELFADLTQRLAMAQDKVAELNEELSVERNKYTAMYEQMWQLEISSQDAQQAKSELETEMQRMIAPETLHQIEEQLAQRELVIQEHSNTITQLMHDKEALISERATLHDTIHRNESEFQFGLNELEREVQHLRRIRNNVENRNAELQSSRLQDLATIHSLEEQLNASEHVHEELQEQLAQRAHELEIAKTIFLSSEQAQEALRILFPQNTAVLANTDVITHLQERLQTVTSALTLSQETLAKHTTRIKEQDEELQQLMQVKEELQVQLLKCTQALKENAILSNDKSHQSTEPLLPSTHVEQNTGEQAITSIESTTSLPSSLIPAFQSSSGDHNSNTSMTLNALRIQVRDLNALLSSTQTERDTLLRAQEQWKKREENLRAELEVLGNDPISATAKKYGLHAIKNFQEQIAEMYGRNEELVEERQQLSSQLDQLQREIEKQHNVNDLLSQEKKQLEHKLERANEQIASIQEALDGANMTIHEFNDKLAACESTIAADEETIGRIENECDNLQNELSEWKVKCAGVEGERDGYTRDNVELIEKLTEMQNVLEHSETEKKSIMNSFEHERKELNTQIDELQHSLAAAKAVASSFSSSAFGSSSSMLFARAQARSRPPISLTANLNVNQTDNNPTGNISGSSNTTTDANTTWQSSVFGRQ